MNRPPSDIPPYTLSTFSQWTLSLLAFFFVAFGQPAWLPGNGLLAAAFGFALFWRVLLAHSHVKSRFYLGTIWFCAVQLVQLSWFISHPYWYIYTIYFLLCVAMGVQFGLIAIFIRPEKFKPLRFFNALLNFLPIAGLWTIFEWTRLFVLSGLSWNPVGLALTSNLYALQAASLAGVFGISFWVILTNLFALWAYMQKKLFPVAIWGIIAILPYFYGAAQLALHQRTSQETTKSFTAVLVQTAFSPEELQQTPRKKTLLELVEEEWGQILNVTKKHKGQPIDLIVLPEFVVPFGTYSDVYPLEKVKQIFFEVLGPESLTSLPTLEYPFFSLQKTPDGLQWFVNNAYWAQAIANYFQADILLGLEDAEDVTPSKREYYSSAIFIHPQKPGQDFFAERYSKRVLVPMGEYIPFEACKKLAERYGIFGSFTCGKEAVVMNSHGTLFSPSICYEETFGNIMREGRQKGADLFVNLTSDVWYPNSKLPRQHLDHARLRTVENGVSLIRACNTGITAAIDSFGRDVAVLGGNHPEDVEWTPNSLLTTFTIYSYPTLYSKWGDFLIIGLCFLLIGTYFKTQVAP